MWNVHNFIPLIITVNPRNNKKVLDSCFEFQYEEMACMSVMTPSTLSSVQLISVCLA